jgi:hypothetical protein
MTFTEYNKALIKTFFNGQVESEVERVLYILEIKNEVDRKFRVYFKEQKEELTAEKYNKYLEFAKDAEVYYKDKPELLKLYKMSIKNLQAIFIDLA